MNTQSSQISDAAPGSHVPVEQRGGADRASSLPSRRRSLTEPVMAFLGRNPLKTAEADLANLTSRRESVLKRLADASAKADEAAAAQRALLIESDNADAAAMKRAGEACRKTQDDVAALQDA